MTTIVLACLIIGLIATALIFAVLTLGVALGDSSFKDIITGKIFAAWFKNIREFFDLKIFIAGVVLFSLVSSPEVLKATIRLEAEKKNECSCDCQKCKQLGKLADKMEAIAEYLDLDEEDIQDILAEKKAKDKSEYKK